MYRFETVTILNLMILDIIYQILVANESIMHMDVQIMILTEDSTHDMHYHIHHIYMVARATCHLFQKIHLNHSQAAMKLWRQLVSIHW